jgi:ribosomal protein S3AE
MAKTKVLKKEWYPILAPKIFGSAVLGETYVYEPEQMLGKTITQNLMNLTNDVKRQNINLNFEVVTVQNGKAFTNIVGYNMMQSSVRRLVRRNIEKVNTSFLCKTSDNKNLQIKPLLITRLATKGSVGAKLRKNTQDFLVKYIGAISYDNLINDLVNHKLQNSLRKESNKIYPLRVCEIRSMEIVDLEKKKQVKAKKTEKKAERRAAKKAQEAKSTESKETKPEKAVESKTEKAKEEATKKKKEKTE